MSRQLQVCARHLCRHRLTCWSHWSLQHWVRRGNLPLSNPTKQYTNSMIVQLKTQIFNINRLIQLLHPQRYQIPVRFLEDSTQHGDASVTVRQSWTPQRVQKTCLHSLSTSAKSSTWSCLSKAHWVLASRLNSKILIRVSAWSCIPSIALALKVLQSAQEATSPWHSTSTPSRRLFLVARSTGFTSPPQVVSLFVIDDSIPRSVILFLLHLG